MNEDIVAVSHGGIHGESATRRFVIGTRSSMLGGVEERVGPGSAFIFAADGVAAAAGAWNAAWLLNFAAGSPPGRRTAAASLAVLNAGIAVHAGFAQALYSARRFGFDTAPFFEPGPWLASRLLLLAGTLLISMLILRRREP